MSGCGDALGMAWSLEGTRMFLPEAPGAQLLSASPTPGHECPVKTELQTSASPSLLGRCFVVVIIAVKGFEQTWLDGIICETDNRKKLSSGGWKAEAGGRGLPRTRVCIVDTIRHFGSTGKSIEKKYFSFPLTTSDVVVAEITLYRRRNL